jgi:advillin
MFCDFFSQTTELKSGARRHDVHYWVGEEAKEVRALES